MPGATSNGHNAVTSLEMVLRLHGDFRRRLAPLHVTPHQAGVLLYLQRHQDAKVTHAAAALRVQLPTMVVTIQDLVRKRWVRKRRSIQEQRAVCLRLSQRGEALARRIRGQIRAVRSELTQF